MKLVVRYVAAVLIFAANAAEVFGGFGDSPVAADNSVEKRIFVGLFGNNVDQNCKCGVPNARQRRIIGGTETGVNEYPWTVYLQVTTPQNVTSLCGGVLVTNRHVLTAGHCGVPGILGRIRVVLGDHDRFNAGETQSVERGVSHINVHPLYNLFTNLNYDFALLTLDSAVNFTNTVRTICLPKSGANYTDRPAVVVGWGRQREGGAGSAVLLKANVVVAGQRNCEETFRNTGNTRITNVMMCAGSANSTEDACEGDSGGPLMVQDAQTGVYTSIGVISFGAMCGVPGALSVHARIDRVLDWIHFGTLFARTCSKS